MPFCGKTHQPSPPPPPSPPGFRPARFNPRGVLSRECCGSPQRHPVIPLYRQAKSAFSPKSRRQPDCPKDLLGRRWRCWRWRCRRWRFWDLIWMGFFAYDTLILAKRNSPISSFRNTPLPLLDSLFLDLSMDDCATNPNHASATPHCQGVSLPSCLVFSQPLIARRWALHATDFRVLALER